MVNDKESFAVRPLWKPSQRHSRIGISRLSNTRCVPVCHIRGLSSYIISWNPEPEYLYIIYGVKRAQASTPQRGSFASLFPSPQGARDASSHVSCPLSRKDERRETGDAGARPPPVPFASCRFVRGSIRHSSPSAFRARLSTGGRFFLKFPLTVGFLPRIVCVRHPYERQPKQHTKHTQNNNIACRVVTCSDPTTDGPASSRTVYPDKSGMRLAKQRNMRKHK